MVYSCDMVTQVRVHAFRSYRQGVTLHLMPTVLHHGHISNVIFGGWSFGT
eukprot:CAMPEP_0179262832 /NCGR_PEP_ID=MMETSP0797-20121207/27568_1 /TAXON_ID=47934 /ORGANISM="Dinophysis acuminata, Strain DAEP01" /LENGTH=49 /DNA_ID= /DNA_START= /DNA_END= /DNA_ORIENTATION=